MTVFIASTALLTLLAVAWFVRPLLRAAQRDGVSSQRLNAEIYRDQLKTLERDLARGAISGADFEATRDELQLRLLDDTDAPGAPARSGTAGFWSGRGTALLLALLLPLGAAAMYGWLGSPRSIDPVRAHAADEAQVAKMIDDLAARLKANPDNPKGWAMLARSLKVMGRMPEADAAYARTGALLQTDPDLMADYADLLAVRAGGNLDGRPMALIEQALALNPQHPMALMLAGVGAYRQGNYAGAVKRWETLLAVVEPGSADATQLEADIADARAKGGMKPATGTRSALAAASAAAPSAPGAAGAGAPPDAAQVAQMVERLAARLKTTPDDLAGWARLARSYKVMGRLPEAEEAYARAGRLIESSPDMLADYADLLATRAGGNIEGRPLALVKQALLLEPRHPMALMLSGTAAFRRGNYSEAVTEWDKLQGVFAPGSPDALQAQANIAEARAKGGLAAAAPARK